MNDHPVTSNPAAENLQSKSNLPSKPILPPKPKFRAYTPKIKVAPIPGEAKYNISKAQSPISNSQQNISTNPSNESTLNKSLNTASKEINANNVIISSAQERSVKINDIINDKSNQLKNHNNINQQSEKDVTILPEQPILIDSSTQQQNSIKNENITSNANNSDILSQVMDDNSQSMHQFSRISVPPPPFKPKQFKYPSGNLTGTNDFPDFDRKLDEILRLSQAPRLRSIKKNF